MLTADYLNTQIQLFGVASCQGAQDQRCDGAPQALKAAGLDTILRKYGIDSQWRQILSPDDDQNGTLAELYQRLGHHVQNTLDNNSPFLVFGGDHSCAIGTWSGAALGLRNRDLEADLGLIWIDAHMDAHTPETSPSGALHGMPVACLLGHGDKKYCDIGFSGAKIKPENICLIGIRSYEKEEAHLLQQLGVKVYFIEDIKAQGLEKIMQLAVNQVSKRCAGIGISIDMDAIDPNDAPGVGSPVENGIKKPELLAALSHLKIDIGDNATTLLGVEIAELNPERDINNKTQSLITDIVHSIFGDSNEDKQAITQCK